MSVIRWLVVQEVCSRFEFARHFVVLNLPAILNLIWPGHLPFICACELRFPMNIPLSQLMLLSTRIIFSTYSFKATVFTILITIIIHLTCTTPLFTVYYTQYLYT